MHINTDPQGVSQQQLLYDSCYGYVPDIVTAEQHILFLRTEKCGSSLTHLRIHHNIPQRSCAVLEVTLDQRRVVIVLEHGQQSRVSVRDVPRFVGLNRQVRRRQREVAVAGGDVRVVVFCSSRRRVEGLVQKLRSRQLGSISMMVRSCLLGYCFRRQH